MLILYILLLMKGKKYGGRVKGTPNKLTTLTKKIMEDWLTLHYTQKRKGANIELIWEDFAALDPRDRMAVSKEFIKILTPRNVDIVDNTRKTIEDQLRILAGVDEENDDDE